MKAKKTRVAFVATAALALLLQACAQNKGECNPPCTAPLTCCSGFCVNTQTSSDNCGECGRECGGGGTCTAGACPVVCGDTTCSPGESCCDDACVDTDDSQSNCGSCGNACDSGWACIDGTCEHVICDPTCTGSETCCPVTGGDPVCADLQSDEDDCGSCGNDCPAGESCSGGLCMLVPCEPACTGGLTCCNGTCVDTGTNTLNCGFCGNECDMDKSDACVGSTCTCRGAFQCNATQQCCPDLGCRTITSDRDNCGECGHACETGLTCTDGECLCGATTCDPGLGCCSGSCRDLMNDEANCGTCGNMCNDSAPTCTDGECLCDGDPPCAWGTFVACLSATVPGPYTAFTKCCPGRGCVPMSDTDCGVCGTACTGSFACEPVPGFWVCNFECIEQYYYDAYTDIDWDFGG